MKTQLLTASIFLASYALSQATLLVSEPFNYTVGANIGAVAATGEGLTGNWQRSFTDTASAILRVDEKSNWSTPNGFGFTASPRIVRTNGDQNNSAAVNLASGAHINFAVDGIIYYSYLLSYGTDNRSRVSFGSSTNIDQVRVQGIADGTLRVYVGSSFTAGASLAGDTDYLVVGRITTNAAGDDEHRIWVYSSSQTIALSDPGTAGSYAAQTGSLSGTASMVQFSNILNAGYGDFRMGTTWEAVVIPEPSTYAAIFGLLAFAGVILLRRRKQ